MTEWRSEYMCVPTWTEDDETRWRLAREYHERTEWFDQMHCRARDDKGFAIPQSSAERTMCSQYAREVRRDLFERMERLGIHDNLQRAISDDVRHFETDWAAGRRHIVTPDPAVPTVKPSSNALYHCAPVARALQGL